MVLLFFSFSSSGRGAEGMPKSHIPALRLAPKPKSRVLTERDGDRVPASDGASEDDDSPLLDRVHNEAVQQTPPTTSGAPGASSRPKRASAQRKVYKGEAIVIDDSDEGAQGGEEGDDSVSEWEEGGRKRGRAQDDEDDDEDDEYVVDDDEDIVGNGAGSRSRKGKSVEKVVKKRQTSAGSKYVMAAPPKDTGYYVSKGRSGGKKKVAEKRDVGSRNKKAAVSYSVTTSEGSSDEIVHRSGGRRKKKAMLDTDESSDDLGTGAAGKKVEKKRTILDSDSPLPAVRPSSLRPQRAGRGSGEKGEKRRAVLESLSSAKEDRKIARERARAILSEGRRNAKSSEDDDAMVLSEVEAEEEESDEFSMIRGMGNRQKTTSQGGTSSSGKQKASTPRKSLSSPNRARRYVEGGGSGGKSEPRMWGDDDEHKGVGGASSGGRKTSIIYSKQIIVCPICYERLKNFVPGAVPGQRFAAVENPDPLEVLEKRLALIPDRNRDKDNIGAFVFPSAKDFKTHARLVHKSSRQYEASQLYLKQLVYNYLTASHRRENMRILESNKKRGHHDDSEDELVSEIQTDTSLIAEYWGVNTGNDNAYKYNTLVDEVLRSTGKEKPLFSDVEEDSESESEEGLDDFIVGDDEEEEESDSETSSSSSSSEEEVKKAKTSSRKGRQDESSEDEEDYDSADVEENRRLAKVKASSSRSRGRREGKEKSKAEEKKDRDKKIACDDSDGTAMSEKREGRKRKSRVLDESDEEADLSMQKDEVDEDGEVVLKRRTPVSKKKIALKESDEDEASADEIRICRRKTVLASDDEEAEAHPKRLNFDKHPNKAKSSQGSTASPRKYGLRERVEKVASQENDDWKEKLKERNRQLLSSNEPPPDIAARSGGQTQVSFQPSYKIRGGECEGVASDSSMDDFVVTDDDEEDEEEEARRKQELKWEVKERRRQMRKDKHSSVKEDTLNYGGESSQHTKAKTVALSGDEEALFRFAEQGDVEGLNEILDKSPSLARARRNQTTPLHAAASAGSVECLKALMQCGAQVNMRDDESGATPLLTAMVAGHEAATVWLLANGGDVMLADKEETLPLHIAAVAFGPEIFDRILGMMQGRMSGNKRIAERRDMHGQQPIHYASCGDNVAVVKHLIKKYGVNPDAQDDKLLTPLHSAAMSGRSECIKALVKECGANIKGLDNEGMTALHHACQSGHDQCIHLLVELGADVNSPIIPNDTTITEGATPLHLAAMSGNPHVVVALIEHGARPEIPDGQGWTPLLYADFCKRRDCIIALLQPDDPMVCQQQINNLADLLYSKTDTTRARAVRVIEYIATFPEFFEAINAYVKGNPRMLDDTLSFLLKNKRLLNFSNKQMWVRRRLKESYRTSSQYDSWSDAQCRIFVDRSNFLQSICDSLLSLTGDELKAPELKVVWNNEEGVGTGPVREFFDKACEAFLKSETGLFEPTPDGGAYHPVGGHLSSERKQRSEALGRLVGLAIQHQICINIRLSRAMVKRILDISVGFADLEEPFPDLKSSLQWTLDTEGSTEILDATFSVDEDVRGATSIGCKKTTTRVIPLCPGGQNRAVTEQNKKEYVDLYASYKLESWTGPFVCAFLKDLQFVIDPTILRIFSEEEFELALCGLNDINIDEWQASTVYNGYVDNGTFGPEHELSRWFWAYVRRLPKESLALLLKFCTGCSSVPPAGFWHLYGLHGEQQFNISCTGPGNDERLPMASTCFNQLKLPQYSHRHALEEKLHVAVHYGSEGFTFS